MNRWTLTEEVKEKYKSIIQEFLNKMVIKICKIRQMIYGIWYNFHGS